VTITPPDHEIGGDKSSPLPLRARTARAAFSSGGGEFASRIGLIVLSIVTARLLEPREVGFLGASVIVIGIISVLGSFAETAAVTLPRDREEAPLAIAATAYRAAFILAALAGTVVVVLWVGLREFREGAADVAFLVAILSVTLLLEIIGTYPRVVLQRDLDLDFIAIAQFLQAFTYICLALALLSNGGRARSVAVAQDIATGVATMAIWIRLMLRQKHTSLRLPRSDEWREVGRRAGGLAAGLIGGFLCERVDNLMVAASIGTTAMSYYSMAWNASHTPANIVGRAISFVLVPTLAHITDDPPRIMRALTECLRYSYFLLAPGCAILFVSSREIVLLVLGEKWLPLVPCLKIMCVSVLSVPLLLACTALLIASGRAILTSIATGIHFLLLVVVIPIVAKKWGIAGAAYGELSCVVVLTSVLWVITKRATTLLNVSVLRRPALFIAAATCAAMVSVATRNVFVASLPRFLMTSIVTFASYVAFVTVFGERSAIFSMGDLLRTMLRRSTPEAEAR
jgi:O-antigen/teichoic acid export membrane protein